MTIKKDSIGNFRDLDVYKKSLLFRKQIYRIVERFPAYEKNNVVDQLRRASCSTSANISEGNANYYYAKEFDRLNTALASMAECRSFLDISVMENYITHEEYQSLDKKAEEIMAMLIGLMSRIEDIIGKEVS